MRTLKLTSVGLGLAVASFAQAGVQSLSSDEMVDTFIQDSAIIVTPREATTTPSAAETRRQVVRALIVPGEPKMTEAEELVITGLLRETRMDALREAQQFADEAHIRRALLFPGGQIAGAQPELAIQLPAQPIFGGSPAMIPDAPYNKSLFNDQLGLSYDGQTLQFSIGQPPGIDQINIPHAIDEGGIQLTPRPGGGFDLSIAVPD